MSLFSLNLPPRELSPWAKVQNLVPRPRELMASPGPNCLTEIMPTSHTPEMASLSHQQAHQALHKYLVRAHLRQVLCQKIIQSWTRQFLPLRSFPSSKESQINQDVVQNINRSFPKDTPIKAILNRAPKCGAKHNSGHGCFSKISIEEILPPRSHS